MSFTTDAQLFAEIRALGVIVPTKTPAGEYRIAPRIGVVSARCNFISGHREPVTATIAEAIAYYATNREDAYQTALLMALRFREVNS